MRKSSSGWMNGLVGVAIFAGSLPATRVAVAELNPVFLTSARAAIAAVLGLALLLLLRQPRPTLADAPALLFTAIGCVLGFPLLTALALQHVTSAHSIVFLGLLPLCTALFAVLRAGEHPRLPFWLFSVVDIQNKNRELQQKLSIAMTSLTEVLITKAILLNTNVTSILEILIENIGFAPSPQDYEEPDDYGYRIKSAIDTALKEIRATAISDLEIKHQEC